MLHVVPEGYEFFHKGVTEATVNKAKQIWIKHGNMKKEDCVVLLGAKNLLQRMETYWETFLHAHPDADICDVVQRMLMSNLYEIDMTDFCRGVSKMDWLSMEYAWVARKGVWWSSQPAEEVQRGDDLPRRADEPSRGETRTVMQIIREEPRGKHVVALQLFRNAPENPLWSELASSGIAGVQLSALETLEEILRRETEAEQDIYSSFPYEELHD